MWTTLGVRGQGAEGDRGAYFHPSDESLEDLRWVRLLRGSMRWSGGRVQDPVSALAPDPFVSCDLGPVGPGMTPDREARLSFGDWRGGSRAS